MYTAADFSQAYDDYIEFNRKLYKEAGPFAGLMSTFGFRTGPAYDVGHEKFFKEMQSAVQAVCEEKPDPETAEQIIQVFFRARETYAQERGVFYMFAAVEGLAKDLIPFLSSDKASALYQEYNARVPKKIRVPVQKEVLEALKKAAEK